MTGEKIRSCRVPIEQEERAKGKRLKDATIWNLVCEICRRIWFCLRRCVRRIIYILSFGRWCRREQRPSCEDEEPFLVSEQDEIKRLSEDIIEYQSRLQEKDDIIYQLRSDRERYLQDIESIQTEMENLRSKLRRAENDVENFRKAKDEALSRLSEMMGRKLRDNNPAITDLNDPNRPMKLGEQFSELYENEWTEAFVALSESAGKPADEEIIIKQLLDILKEINCESISESNLQLPGILKSVEDQQKDGTSDFIKPLKDALKVNANKCWPLIYKKITAEDSPCKTVTTCFSQCQQYIESCVKVCFFAAIQDPPMYLHFDAGEVGNVYDKQVFREYTATGIRLRFLVWPALYLYKGGAILSKGVVQPLQETSNGKEEVNRNVSNGKEEVNRNVSNGKEEVNRNVSNGKEEVNRNVSNGKEEVNRNVSNGKEEVNRNVSNGKEEVNRNVSNGKEEVYRNVSNGKEEVYRNVSNGREDTITNTTVLKEETQPEVANEETNPKAANEETNPNVPNENDKTKPDSANEKDEMNSDGIKYREESDTNE